MLYPRGKVHGTLMRNVCMFCNLSFKNVGNSVYPPNKTKRQFQGVIQHDFIDSVQSNPGYKAASNICITVIGCYTK